ncbi:hypothetical protein GJAV_G00001970 [Gymnothorax javanicus]|nr:hypothetical protein GJAV_G00001970 [Gymnothorax javanicus]
MFAVVAMVFLFQRFTAAFEVTVPEWRVVGVRGRPVVLGCSFTPDPVQTLQDLTVTWQRVEDDQILHSYYFGRDQLDRQSHNYRNRTSLFPSLLRSGNASLRLERVGLSDSGRYLCSVSARLGIGKQEVQLEYAAFYSEPRLRVQAHLGSVSLQFESEGYPEPLVQWVDEAGQNLTVKEELSGPNEDGLFHLRSGLTVEDPSPLSGANLSFTLRNPVLGQELQRPVSVSQAPVDPGHSRDCRTEAVLLSVFLILCLGLAAYVFFLYKRRRGPRTKKNSLQMDSVQPKYRQSGD